jgi:2-octaprenyl-6-methoxyphenol hydroxylase
MAVDGPRGVIGLEGLIAHRMAGRRVALVGEAGHRLPPIGAQGLNLGLRDSEALARILGRAFQYEEDVGGERVLARYHRARWIDVTTRTGGVDLLNRSLLTGLPPVALGRSLTLTAAKHLGPLRRIMMRAGMGQSPLRLF